MTTARQRKKQRELELVQAFNDAHPVGTAVRYWKMARGVDEPSQVSATRSSAELLSGHTAVVWVDGEAACIALSHVEVVS